MATLRGTGNSYTVGVTPPDVTWTIVRGDTAAFRVYVTDDAKQPITVSDWDIQMDVKRPTTPGNIDDTNASLIVTLIPAPTVNDGAGEFTVSVSSTDSSNFETGDIFDIELSDATRVWTVARGTITIIEDVTNRESH